VSGSDTVISGRSTTGRSSISATFRRSRPRNGAPLPREHGGPWRIITPRLYAWKGAKWIRKIELLDADRPGFWKTRSYSNTAAPWLDDRYFSA